MGIEAYLIKPVGENDLFEAIAKTINSKVVADKGDIELVAATVENFMVDSQKEGGSLSLRTI